MAIVRALQAGKYLTAEKASFEEGDWNGDGVFDQLDIVTTLAHGVTDHPIEDERPLSLFRTESEKR